MKLSIVSTLYQSEIHIREFHQRIVKTADEITDDYEIIFVDDGSPDESLTYALKLVQLDPRVYVVELSRNFGHHKAMMAGLSHATGEYVFLIDVDLEEEPELLGQFWKELTKERAKSIDVIYGVQENRKGDWFERWSGKVYYRILNVMLNIKHPKNIATARLMTRRYVDALLLHKERETVISGLWIITGFIQQAISIKKTSTSRSSYNIFRKFSHFVNAITSFSNKPLKAIFFIGLVIFSGALVYTLYLIFNRLIFSAPLDGWTSIMASIWLLGGIIISFIGLIGIYLSKIFIETKQRPPVIVKEIHGKSRH